MTEEGYAGAKIMNDTLFKDQPDLPEEERDARAAARTATKVGAALGVAGAGAATVAGGASGATIMGTLAGIGGVVGGGAIAGTVVVAAAAAIGYVRSLFPSTFLEILLLSCIIINLLDLFLHQQLPTPHRSELLLLLI